MKYLWFSLVTMGCINSQDRVQQELIGESDRPAWDPDPQTISNTSSSSSVAWTPPEEEYGEPMHYTVLVTSEFDELIYEGETQESQIELTQLRTDTEYQIEITACYDPSCREYDVGESLAPPAWRTEVENWVFPQIEGERITPLMERTYAPSIIDLSEYGFAGGWILTTIQQDTWKQLHLSHLQDILIDDTLVDFEMSSPTSLGLQDVPSIIELTSSSIRPIQENGEWKLQLFVSLQAHLDRERSMIGSWTAGNGFDGINLFTDQGDLCELSSLDSVCGMNTCMDSADTAANRLDRMDCISILPGHTDLMLIQGRSNSNDETPPNLYLAQSQRDGSWSALSLDGGEATPLIKDATGASIWTQDNLSKLYYWDEASGNSKLRYWDPSTSGDENTLDLSDLESDDRSRNVYYTDSTGEKMVPWNFKVVERSFITVRGKQIMLASVEMADGTRHITYGVLSNP